MKIIITGGTGFIGGSVLGTLVNDKRITEILALGLKKPAVTSNRIKFKHCDLINKRLRINGYYDVLIHFAELMPYGGDLVHFSNNVKIIENLINNVVLARRVKKVVYSSSIDVYGKPQYHPVDENHPEAPLTFYGASKLANELFLKTACKKENVNLILLRFSQVYGPCEPIAKVIPVLIEKIRKGQTFQIQNNGNTIRDWVYIKDIVQAIEKVLAKKIDNDTLNIASGKGYSLKQLVQLLEKKLNKNARVRWLKTNSDLRPKLTIDIDRAVQSIGYQPLFDLKKGLDDYLKNSD